MASLYFSEIQKLPVCHLCWYQRICLYPLVIILGIGAFRDDKNSVFYAFPLAILGLFFAIYQYLEQMIPGFSPIGFCSTGINCNMVDFIFWGFVTLPLLSAVSFLMIIVLLIIRVRAEL